MKRNLKVLVSVVLILSIVFSIAGCSSKDVAGVKEEGRKIVDNLFECKYSKILKAFDKSSKNYDIERAVFDTFFIIWEEEISFMSDLDFEYKKEEVAIKDSKATINYLLEVEDEEYSFELNLNQDGSKWIIDDNKDFILNVFNLIFEISSEEGTKSCKTMIDLFMVRLDVSNVNKLAKPYYTYLEEEIIDSSRPAETVVESTDSTEPTETSGDITETIPSEDISVNGNNDEYLEFSMLICYPGTEIDYDNDIQNIITELTNTCVREEYLWGQTEEEAINSMLASGQLRDYVYSTSEMTTLYEAGVLIAWDEYIEKYPNIRELHSDEEWELLRQDDGHIYWTDAFNNTYGESQERNHNEGAFWIQARVLEWAGYPEIKTLDQYFNLLDSYYDANPVMPDGTPNIPYTMLCDDWRYFCIECPPLYLAGYPNDRPVIVNTTDYDKPTIVDYDTSDTAKAYFAKLNEQYNLGYINEDFASQSYDEYIDMLTTGAVLGMYDEYWDFGYTLQYAFSQDQIDLGCEYVPLGLTIDENTTNHYHVYQDSINILGGIGVTVNCINPDRAFSFINDLLSQEIHDLRFWGIEGVDYLIDENGLYYRTNEMQYEWEDYDYQSWHGCEYLYLPQWNGTSRDGINAMQSSEQRSIFIMNKSEAIKNIYEAYDAYGYAEMLNSDKLYEPGCWYPMYTYSNYMTTETPGGVAKQKIENLKHDYLPELVMTSDFESAWYEYINLYNECNPQDFIDEMQTELDYRIEHAN
ncbi:MAG: sugar ABC transporter substrate-binding protein [Clostridia bacterium]|nr:sugar ABC transporter substrate-binding protein [Clostridia bacterium]